jgi:hypothetical protein
LTLGSQTTETWDRAPSITHLYPLQQISANNKAMWTGRRVLLSGGPNQYKSLCTPICATIRGPALNPRNSLAGSYGIPKSSHHNMLKRRGRLAPCCTWVLNRRSLQHMCVSLLYPTDLCMFSTLEPRGHSYV